MEVKVNKYEIADILNKIGLLLELKGESFFKSKAYYDAAKTLEMLDEEIETLVLENRLAGIRGFGQALVSKVTELVTTGRLEYYENLLKSIPPGLLEMMRIPGLGAKKVKAIYETLGITTIDELRKACLEGRIASIKNFGEKTQDHILKGINNLEKTTDQFLFVRAEEIAYEFLGYLKETGLAENLEVAGSLRRKKEIIKDVDILASTTNNAGLIEKFTEHHLVDQVVSKGGTKAAVILKNGMNVDLMVVSNEEFPYALHHFTGSREYNIAIRHFARLRDVRINEYGLFHGDSLIRCKNEEQIFEYFSMQYIPPELRENNGEIESALRGEIPVLVCDEDIKGILHVHTNYSDGVDSIEKMALYCMRKGYGYLGITDHSKSAYYAGGLSVEEIKRQHEEIDRLNEKYRPFRILKGIEVDILQDGSLDYSDEVLDWFDFTIASVHSAFRMDGEKMTCRVVSALKSKRIDILGHPTGRLLLAREPYNIDINEVIRAAAENKVAIEINANPRRLDLDWRFCRPAKGMGCKFVICPDAHRTGEIDEIRFGINIARKGWLTKEDIINTLNADEILNKFRQKRLKD